ncbi:MAG: hypothetical protein HRU69_02625 [Flammeovirgaceae bacterium]|nr:MAG: hypothetical protein HRU69_02625 [Flammeovirgaceae bacterium]
MSARLSYYLIILLLAAHACKPPQQSTAAQGGRYHEDLSAYRPVVQEVPSGNGTTQQEPGRDPKAYVEAQYAVNKQVDFVLDSIDRINLTRKFIDGFTIQVHSGLKRDDALNVKKNLLAYLPHLESEIQYIQPNFRVKTGKYVTRLDAQKDYMAVKRYFPGAIVVPDKIPAN